MNWLLYLPPLLAIYLLAISGLTSRYIRNRIQESANADQALKDKSQVIQNIAVDWSGRLSFFNAMFTGMVSVFSIYSKTNNYRPAVVTFVVLLLIFIVMMWWIMDHAPGELAAIKFRRVPISHADLCRIVLIVLNVILLLTIAYSETDAQTAVSSRRSEVIGHLAVNCSVFGC